MSARSFLARLREWFLRSAAMREARAVVAGPGGRRKRASTQAELLAEVARRVAEPVEPLPSGSRAAVRLALYRDTAYWALAALRPDETNAPDLATLWNETPPEQLEQAAGGIEAAEAVKKTLIDDAAAPLLEVTDEDAARAGKFVAALFAELEVPRRRVERVSFQRWWRISLAAVAFLLAAYGVRALVLGPNLAAGRPYRVSSAWAGCPPCEGIFFHTEKENNPWLEYDLGKPKAIHRIEVTNRPDCCRERAIPLIVEMSNDRTNWTEVVRREKEFTNWTATFPKRTARYVRLRVPRVTELHFKEVALR
jgi:hypothetical protein